jgi:hypothetical protein
MCEVRSKGKTTNNQKKNYNDHQQKEMDYDEPHLVLNEKMQPIQWTKRPIGALVAASSLGPIEEASTLIIKGLLERS